MINRAALLSGLQGLLKRLEDDLLQRSESAEVPQVGQRLREEYEKAKKAQRTAQNYEDWRSDAITQAAAAWVLSCVFVRFLEDNRLIAPPKIAGPGKELQRARDEHELFFRSHPKLTDRDYLLSVFDDLARLPGTREVFGEHNPIRELPNWISGDAAGELLRFFQKIDANTGLLVHDFTDDGWDTRFLGDLYQDLSEAARKRYALLQTPEFVEEFILDRTLDPALEEFGLDGFRMIDPACGSGHFLLGSFRRVLRRWQQREPGAKSRELVQRTFDSIHGVDVNPYAVAIARFRLLLMAMQAEGVQKLAGAPGYRFHLAVGDSLLHGKPGGDQLSLGWHDVDHVYHAEDRPALQKLLAAGRYHAVVANPPYITPKDRALNEEYRERYPKVCHMKYSLAVPFMQRLFDLACPGGFTGQITANSFMKREFGKKVIEQFLPTVDLTHVVDTSGAYIPGHGTPTVLLFGRNRTPVATTIRTVMGIRGEPSTPDDPAQGLVWSAIAAQIDQPGSQSDFVSAGDSAREAFHKHPWSIGGGGAAELKDQLDETCATKLSEVISEAGVFGMTNADDVMLAPLSALARKAVEPHVVRRLSLGDEVRDWIICDGDGSLFPYTTDELIAVTELPQMERWLWCCRTVLGNRATFSRETYFTEGRPWWEWHQVALRRLRTPLSLIYGEVATHNHFVLDRGGKVFNRTSPVIKLPAEASEDDHLALLGLLNSSTACFWLKQVCHQKQMMGGDGIRIESKAKVPYAFNATQVGRLPVPASWSDGPLRRRLLELTRTMDTVSGEYASLSGRNIIQCGPAMASSIRSRWASAVQRRKELRSQQVLLQEEIDFTVYRMFDLVHGSLLSDDTAWAGVIVTEGDRPFCIVDGTNEEGFPVPSSTPTTWPRKLCQLWDERIEAIRNSRDLRLIESSMYKRRWIGRQGLFNHSRTDDELGDAAREWLTDRLETFWDFDGRIRKTDAQASPPSPIAEGTMTSVARLADVARQDPDFMQVGELYRNDPAFDVERLVTELVEPESVPLLPVLRYKPSGLRKRAEWEKTWELQRDEDRTGNRLPIPTPPKYEGKDFLKTDYNRLRGKLDVPKERWVSFPHCEGPDGTLVIAWAGYDHLQLARSISSYYVDIQERLGGRDDPRLVPLLAGLLELLPWLKQWHNEPDAAYDGMRMGDYFEGFLNEEARQLGQTLPDIKAWQPPKRNGGRGKKAKAP